MGDFRSDLPLGTDDPQVFYANVSNLDEAVTTRESESWVDRKGVTRQTWYGMEEAFQEFLINSGYENIGDYGSGLNITARNQIFWKDGELYRAGASLALQYTTTGDWGTEEGLFVAVGDAALRQELSNVAMGSMLVSRSTVSFETVAQLTAANVSTLEEGRNVSVAGYYTQGDGGGGTYTIRSTKNAPDSFCIELDDGRFAVLTPGYVHPAQVGYKTNTAELDTLVKVQANWLKLKNLLADFKATRLYEITKFDKLLTPNSVHMEWYAGRDCPVGFYSDSTTDGAGTTGHVPSTPDYANFKVNINESPNAYPAKLEEYIKLLNRSSTPVRCYNGGFDSQSYKNGFGLNMWHNTWFRGLSGSNVDWSDVRMIVLGFGTSDSINLDDPGAVIDSYSVDLECTIIDCFLRGVQPVLQSPVMTVQKVGTTVDYRNANESITLIEAMQDKLCEKYNLDYFSYTKSWQQVFNAYSGLRYEDLMNADMIHPTDMGHRVHAAYLANRFCPDIVRLGKNDGMQHIFAGHPAYITVYSEIVSPPSQGGVILNKLSSGVASDDSYRYQWLDSEGNGKTAGDLLARVPVYVEKPCLLYIKPTYNNRTDPRPVSVNSTLVNSQAAVPSVFDTFLQPHSTYFSHKVPVMLLPFGLNIVNVNASSDSPDQQFGGFYLVPLDEIPAVQFGRGTAGADYMTKSLSYPDVLANYVIKETSGPRDIQGYYNGYDAQSTDLVFNLTNAFTAPTAYRVYTHYNDVLGPKDCYNCIEILGNDIKIIRKNSSSETVIRTTTVSGLTALCGIGAEFNIRFTPSFTTNAGVRVQIFINGVMREDYTAAKGALWSDGYGFNVSNILCKDIRITSRWPVQGFGNLSEVI